MLTEILTIGLLLISLVLIYMGLFSIKEKAIRKYFLFVSVLTVIFFVAVQIANAQEKPDRKTGKANHSQMMMSDSTTHNCMDKIASDNTMRMQMMNMMMDHMKGDSSGMMQMGRMMMNNPEMHMMMMEMMRGEGMMDGGMMNHNMNMMKDSTKTMDKSNHEHNH